MNTMNTAGSLSSFKPSTMLYSNHSGPHWSQNQSRHTSRNDYIDDDDDDDDNQYYSPPRSPYQRPPPPLQQQTPASSRRRANPVSQDPSHFYHRHRDDRDSGWGTSGPAFNPDLSPHPPRRQTSTTTNGTSDYGVPLTRTRSRRARSSSAPRAARSDSSSPRRHATTLPTAPPILQLTLSERETLARQRLQSTFETYVFNTLPTYLLRVADMTLVTRNEIWEAFKPRIESLSDSHLAKLLLEQDEHARMLGVSVVDPDVIAPFTEYIRSMISFAIFSHQWGNAEPLFHELPSKKLQVSRRPSPSAPGYQKLVKFCEKARTDYGCEYVWSDTCCINKESSTEVEEAILSMGAWYSEAGICIVHLGNSLSLEDFLSESWFTRGWTLQELLLARKIRFYGKNWSPICPTVVEGRREERAPRESRESREDQRVNDKDNDAVVAAITKVTGIPEADVRNFSPSCTRVSEKMRWAARRATSRIEDVAYSLLGLFDITIPIAYGEGARAFYKLVSAIAEQCTDPDFFAWTGKASKWSLALPSAPLCYSPQASISIIQTSQTFQASARASSQAAQAQGQGQGQGQGPGEMLIAPSNVALGDPAYALTKLGVRIRLVLVPTYCEPLEPTDAYNTRFMLTPALATTAQEPIQVHVPLGGAGVSGTVQQEPRERYGDIQPGRGREREREREREFALGVVDYDGRAGPPGYAALHGGRAHLCLVLERERRGRGWVRMARPGVVSVRFKFRETELLAVESVCLLHRGS